MRKEQNITTNNNQMEEKGMKSRFIHFKKRFVPPLSGSLMGVMLMSTTCFAAGTGTSAVTQPLENLKTLIICSHWCCWCHYSCKECYGVRTSISAAGFIYHELRSERNCGRCHDGWYFNSSDILRLLRLGKCISPFSKRKEVNNKYGYF